MFIHIMLTGLITNSTQQDIKVITEMWKNISAKKTEKVANLEFKDLKNKIKSLVKPS